MHACIHPYPFLIINSFEQTGVAQTTVGTGGLEDVRVGGLDRVLDLPFDLERERLVERRAVVGFAGE